MISNENQKLLELLANSIHQRFSPQISFDEWSTITKELQEQSVYAIPADNVNNCHYSEIDSYLQLVGRNIQIFHDVMTVQQEILQLLENEHIKAVVLKGAAAAVNYPVPEYRCMGDIDLIVQPDDFRAAYQCLQAAGYRTEESPDFFHRHIGFHTPQGVEIELHNFFSTSSIAEQNAILDEYIYQGIQNRENIQLYNYSVYVLSPLANGLVLLAHINQHLSTGLGLRQIIDWMCFAEKYLNDTYWNEVFSEATEKIGMKKLAIATSAMCQKYLGMDSGITWCKGILDDSVCDEFMEYILAYGNFGHKESTNASTISKLRKFKHPIKGFIQIQRSGCREWKALKKHPWLKPFAWIYEITRWISVGKKRGVTISSVIHANQREKTETELLKKLGVTRF